MNFLADFFRNTFKKPKESSEFLYHSVIMMEEYGDGRKEYYIREECAGLEGGSYYYEVTDPENRKKS